MSLCFCLQRSSISPGEKYIRPRSPQESHHGHHGQNHHDHPIHIKKMKKEQDKDLGHVSIHTDTCYACRLSVFPVVASFIVGLHVGNRSEMYNSILDDFVGERRKMSCIEIKIINLGRRILCKLSEEVTLRT